MDSKQLLVEALRLSDEERAALAGELIQSLETEVDADAEAAWSAEIRARLDRVNAGSATTIPWSEARRRIHAAAGRGPRRLNISQKFSKRQKPQRAGSQSAARLPRPHS